MQLKSNDFLSLLLEALSRLWIFHGPSSKKKQFQKNKNQKKSRFRECRMDIEIQRKRQFFMVITNLESR